MNIETQYFYANDAEGVYLIIDGRELDLTFCSPDDLGEQLHLAGYGDYVIEQVTADVQVGRLNGDGEDFAGFGRTRYRADPYAGYCSQPDLSATNDRLKYCVCFLLGALAILIWSGLWK